MSVESQAMNAVAKALLKVAEAINNHARKSNSTYVQNVTGPEGLDPVEIYDRTKEIARARRALNEDRREQFEAAPEDLTGLPAYLMDGRDEIDWDNEAANGVAKLSSEGLIIKITPDNFSDSFRRVMAYGEPVAVTIGVNHRKPV